MAFAAQCRFPISRISPVQSTNADLHSHSLLSDGTLTPEALALRARANGVELWALTDHDEVAGQARAAAAALAAGLDYLTGVEVSVTFAGETVHVLGLGIDPALPALVNGLAAIRAGRDERARAMGESLARAGIAGAYAGAIRHAGGRQIVSRTHFARHLVDTGVAPSVQEVFRRFLVEGKPGFVPHRWASLAEAVGWIVAAGGIPTIAHPARYRFTPNAEWALFDEFVQRGGRAVEVVCASHWPNEVEKYADLALEFGLLASRGSDFHDPLESRVDLGRVAPLPARVAPVWEALESRIVRAEASGVEVD